MMRCGFVFAAYDRPCGHPPAEGARVPLPNGDKIEFLLCESHAMAYRAIMMADAERAHRAAVYPEPPGTADDAPEPDEP